ncbi:hypothetical protein DXT99_01790 [Pontibacter diazotrophicus]|uniref:Uncharacterized protein n=1 Tax=Pontibacter diazotrophicus TaxID=1400979 RepID=A0A3D8LHG8_9BACT|nr:hypothetical protein [Pontibacter diazotrophicus]RDV16870.1 hypothetical protein DXT99_01790 [Pontibacter diazotrophicus]
MNKSNSLLFLIFGLTICLAREAVAQRVATTSELKFNANETECKGAEIRCFDEDNNFMISLDELTKYLIERYNIQLSSETDADADGKIDAIHTFTFISDMQRIYGTDTFYFEQVERVYPSPKKYLFFKLPILIRESLENVSPYENAKGRDKAKPAIFSFGRDYNKEANTWIAKGTIMYSPDSKNEKKIFIFPSISFNRVMVSDTSQSENEANSLVLRVGLHRVFTSTNPQDFIQVQALRVYINSATDFSLESKQSGIEVEWEPLLKYRFFGNYYSIVPPPSIGKVSRFDVKFSAFLKAETGYIFVAAEKENLKNDEGYSRAGGKAALDLRFFERLQLSASKTYLHGLRDSSKNSQLTEFSANYSLGENDEFGLKLEYQKGNVPITLEEVENILFGVSIKL